MTSPSIFQFCEPQEYTSTYQQMRDYTLNRTDETPDAIWLLQHHPVFTQGQAGKPEHIHDIGDIPLIQSDRGGQVTYHGPGQLMIYTLFDLKRLNSSIKIFTNKLQEIIILLLHQYKITAHTQCAAPGVYIDGAKICSLGLRVRHGRTYHGLSLNVKMDLSPFKRINPCGFTQLKMTQISDFVPNIMMTTVTQDLLTLLTQQLTPHTLWRTKCNDKLQ